MPGVQGGACVDPTPIFDERLERGALLELGHIPESSAPFADDLVVDFFPVTCSPNHDGVWVSVRINGEPKQRCLSGGCPECGRLFQRWFVRRSRTFVAKNINLPWNHLVAISIVPWTPRAELGKLFTVDIINLQRRLKDALKKADIDIALGGIDFSFNEDHNGKYVPFWSPHFYLITSTDNKMTLRKRLRKLFLQSDDIPRPIMISDFDNGAYCRSYALKMSFKRRVGYDDVKIQKKGTIRACRNANRDKLRAAERLELFIYLDQIGLGPRIIFRGAKPVMISPGVKIQRC
jgi:hypothetical protein